MPMRARNAGTGSRSEADSMICRSPMKRVPTSRFASCTSTARPARASTIAAARPDGPAPAMWMGEVPDIESKVSYRAVSEANPVTAPASAPRARRFGGYAALVAAGILLSRIAGLVRTRVMAHYLGNSRAADAFAAALKVPNFLQNLFGEGVLSASFIPVYARTLARGDEKLAGRVAGVIVTILALVTSVFVLIGV